MSDCTNNYNYTYKTNTKVPYTLVGLIIPLTKNNILVNA